MTDDHKAILGFWRDVEIFNIPKTPKTESDERLLVAKYKKGDPLPWESGHARSRLSDDVHVWTHAVFVGVASALKWSRFALKAACPREQLSDEELENLSGDAWLAAFVVDSGGQASAESYVPASFALGIRRLLQRKSLDSLNDEIQSEIDAFKSRRAPTIAVKREEGESDTEPDGEDSARSGSPPVPPAVCTMGWPELDQEWDDALRWFDDHAPIFPRVVVIKSIRRKRRREAEEAKPEIDIDFLNSFYLNDLDRLIDQLDQRRDLGAALASYIGPSSPLGKRQDVLTQPEAMAACLSPTRMTLGRWPASSEHPLMLAQQAAVGTIAALNQAGSGMVAVNGPPGTGKTTLLCDVVADVVVRRACALAELDAPGKAFGGQTTIGGINVYPLKAEIVDGTGIVVASNNNAAVENITRELPAHAKIATSEHADAAYLADVAANVFAAAGIKMPAWGLVAAALGNRKNRDRFAKAFFHDVKSRPYEPGKPCDVKTLLEAQTEDAIAQWHDAKAAFLDLLRRVEADRARFSEVAHALAESKVRQARLAQAQREQATCRQALDERANQWATVEARSQSALAQAKTNYAAAVQVEQQAQLATQSATDRLQVAERENLPSLWDRCLRAIGMATPRYRAWQAGTHALRLKRADASDAWRNALASCERAKRQLAALESAWAVTQRGETEARATLLEKIAALEQQLGLERAAGERDAALVASFRATGATMPDEAFFQQPMTSAHLASAWVTPAFDLLRAQLFVAALRLHETTLFACKKKVIPNLRAAMGMLTRDTREPIKNSERSLLWNMLFFCVPVVSSSLASFDRLFTGLERETLGWLLIDEAGQATPQSIAGAVWRSRRVVIIGDPKQVEPVMTVPSAIVSELRNRHNVDVAWSPSMASAQTVADRTMRVGAWIGDPGQAESALWTGLPLRAHRRCIDPMFRVANAIAYEDQMVQANHHPDAIECALGASAWLDVAGQINDGQVVQEEMQRLAQVLERLKRQWPTVGRENHTEYKHASVFVISPFRKVAKRCEDIVRRSELFKTVKTGTVHTFQGKEADIVIVVLGSAPGQAGQGSREWASKRANLLNVALTRAKLRVFVIGNVEDWRFCPHFKLLVDDFQQSQRILSGLPDERIGLAI